MVTLPAPVVGVIVVAIGLLYDRLPAFFDLNFSEQMGILLLILAPLLHAVSASSSTFGGQRRFAVISTPPPHEYPLEKIADADTDKEKFLCVYPQLREELLEWFKTQNEMTPEAVKWIREMMDYTVPGGKLNRGTTVLAVYRALKGSQSPTTSLEYAQAAVLGWTIEFLQAFFLVADDIMDESETRRGQPCWYKKDSVKLIAINDSFLLESAVFYILKRHFGDEPFYTELLELLLQTTQQTELGQLLDLTSQPQGGKVDLDRFTLERYRLIVRYKTAFYSFYLPVALGMILAGNTDPDAYKAAKDILLVMGEYFQVQDDYLDCFGDPAVIGKVGTDIQDNKCSWLVVKALERCDEKQKTLLKQNYGVWDDKKVEKVKKLFRELDLPKVFADYEEDSYQRIQTALNDVKLPRDVFQILLNKIYKRSK